MSGRDFVADWCNAYLHNMSCAPRTVVRGYVAPLRSPIVRFSLGPDLASRVRRRRLARRLVEEAERAWGELSFTGAALVFPWHDDVAQPPEGRPRPEVRVATDPRTLVNVLGRARGSLLLARWPLSREPEYLLRSLASDDPRLVALAERTGWEVRP